MINWFKEKIKKFKKWVVGVLIGGTAVAIAATVLPTDPQFAVGDKVKYVGDLTSAYNKAGWIVDIEPQFDTPYMVAFTEPVDHAEEVAKWRVKYNPYSSHPFPYNLPEDLRWDYENRAWASASQLEIIATAYSKSIKKYIDILMPVKLETGSIEELQKAKDILTPPNKLNIEIK